VDTLILICASFALPTSLADVRPPAAFRSRRSPSQKLLETVAPKYYGAWGIDLSGRDLSVQPGDNFYRYANGAWDDRTEIPPDRTSFSNFAVLAMLGNST
jgi:putative endopeptidase